MVLGGFRSFLVLVLTHIPFYIRERHKAKIKKQKISLVIRFYARDLGHRYLFLPSLSS